MKQATTRVTTVTYLVFRSPKERLFGLLQGESLSRRIVDELRGIKCIPERQRSFLVPLLRRGRRHVLIVRQSCLEGFGRDDLAFERALETIEQAFEAFHRSAVAERCVHAEMLLHEWQRVRMDIPAPCLAGADQLTTTEAHGWSATTAPML